MREGFPQLLFDNNKMALFQHDLIPSRSNTPPLSTNGGSGKRKIAPVMATVNEHPHSTHWYYPPYNIPPKTLSRGFSSYGSSSTHNLVDEGDLDTEKVPIFSSTKLSLCMQNDSVTEGSQLNETPQLQQPRNSNQTTHHVKREDFSDVDVTTNEVVRIIGPRLFHEIRKWMIRQQEMFSYQKFELHRLIKVQRLMATSPETLYQHSTKASIKFPPMNNLLYVSPLDTSSVTKTKPNAVTDGHIARPSTPRPTPIPAEAKLPPWSFPAPPGNQWLIPVRSPSEGLVYKPYPGPCFPYMTPFYGSYDQACDQLPQSYFQPYPMPPFVSNQVKDKSSFKLACDGGGAGRESGKALSEEAGSPPGRDALSLFPTTPSDHKKEHKVQVIRVVPHNRSSAPASAARIFQSIQEGRRQHH